jgi:hypothetical protein
MLPGNEKKSPPPTLNSRLLYLIHKKTISAGVRFSRVRFLVRQLSVVYGLKASEGQSLPLSGVTSDPCPKISNHPAATPTSLNLQGATYAQNNRPANGSKAVILKNGPKRSKNIEFYK